MSLRPGDLIKLKAACECGMESCTLYGTLGRPRPNGRRHVRGCACPSCRGRRNRKSGLAKQSKAARALGVQSGKFVASNEESWSDALFANEVKSGKQCGPLETWWRNAENQVLANEAHFGDRRRPVRAVAMPAGWRSDEGLVVVRLSTWQALVRPALEQTYGGTA